MFFGTGCPKLLDDFVNLSLTVNNKTFSLRIYFSKGLNFPAVALINSPKNIHEEDTYNYLLKQF